MKTTLPTAVFHPHPQSSANKHTYKPTETMNNTKTKASSTAPRYARTSPNRFSWKPELPDHRDLYWHDLKNKTVVPNLSRIKTLQVEDQGDLGSCVGNAGTTMFETAANSSVQRSRLMAYYLGREIDGTIRQDAGTYGRSLIKGMIKNGVAAETLWPYNTLKFKTRPNKAAFADALTFKKEIEDAKLKYYRVETLDECLQVLSTGRTFMFGFSVTDAIDNLPKSAMLSLPGAKDAIIGGHEVVAVGHSLKQKFIWVQNSWGSEFGVKGCFKMPFSWFTDPRRLVDDIWTLA